MFVGAKIEKFLLYFYFYFYLLYFKGEKYSSNEDLVFSRFAFWMQGR